MGIRSWICVGLLAVLLAGDATAQAPQEGMPGVQDILEVTRKGTLAFEATSGYRPLEVRFSTEVYSAYHTRQLEGQEVRLIPGYCLEMMRPWGETSRLSHYFTVELPLSYFSMDRMDWTDGQYHGAFDMRRLAMGVQVGFGVNLGEPLVLICRGGEDFYVDSLEFQQAGGDPYSETRTFAGTRFRLVGGISLVSEFGEVSLLYEYQGVSADGKNLNSGSGEDGVLAVRHLNVLDDQTLTLRLSARF